MSDMNVIIKLVLSFSNERQYIFRTGKTILVVQMSFAYLCCFYYLGFFYSIHEFIFNRKRQLKNNKLYQDSKGK